MELGSEYHLEVNHLSIVEDHYLSWIKDNHYCLFDSGRSAIKSIEIEQNKKVLLPEYICESVIECFQKEKLEFYKIKEDLTIDYNNLKNKITDDIGTLVIVHYMGMKQAYGQLKEIRKLCQKYNILVIEDITQSMLSVKEYVGDYIIASLRKYFPLPNGGIVFSKEKMINKEYASSLDNQKVIAMILKDLYLRKELDCNEKYRKIFIECEKKIDDSNEIKLMSDFSKFLLNCISTDEVIRKRRKNYKYLEKELSKYDIRPVCNIEDSDCPFTFLIRTNNRNKLREYLIENHIYCAVHWPFDGVQTENRLMGELNSKTLLSLPIDQRYDEKELDYLVQVLAKYEGELTYV